MGLIDPEVLRTASSFSEVLRVAQGDRPQVRLAEDLDVSESRVSRWLKGGTPDETNIARVAKGLGVRERDLRAFLADVTARPGLRMTTAEHLEELGSVINELGSEVAALRRAYAERLAHEDLLREAIESLVVLLQGGLKGR